MTKLCKSVKHFIATHTRPKKGDGAGVTHIFLIWKPHNHILHKCTKLWGARNFHAASMANSFDCIKINISVRQQTTSCLLCSSAPLRTQKGKNIAYTIRATTQSLPPHTRLQLRIQLLRSNLPDTAPASASVPAPAYLSLNQLWKPENNKDLLSRLSRPAPPWKPCKNFVYLCKNLITPRFASQECTKFFIFIIKTFGHGIQSNQRPKFSAANWFDIFSLFPPPAALSSWLLLPLPLPLINKLWFQ